MFPFPFPSSVQDATIGSHLRTNVKQAVEVCISDSVGLCLYTFSRYGPNV